MENKYFKVSYQGVYDWLGYLTFVVILWYILSKYFEQITNPENYQRLLEVFTINSSFELVALLAFLLIIIILVYWISCVLVNLLYYWYYVIEGRAGRQTIYPLLKEGNILIPLSKKDYWDIKEHPKFTIKYPDGKETDFSYYKLNEWAEKIIGNEIKKLGGDKK